MTTNVCHSVVRSLDALKTLSLDDQLKVHRKLVSSISKFEPEHDLFAQVPRSDSLNIKVFERREVAANSKCSPKLSPKDFPRKTVEPLKDCPIQSRTLSGWLRAGVAPPQAEPQTWMSQNWPSPTAEIWPPKSLSGANPPCHSCRSP